MSDERREQIEQAERRLTEATNEDEWLTSYQQWDRAMFQLTKKQESTIHNLIVRLGKPKYQDVKQQLGIPAHVAFVHLDRRTASKLISKLIDARDEVRR